MYLSCSFGDERTAREEKTRVGVQGSRHSCENGCLRDQNQVLNLVANKNPGSAGKLPAIICITKKHTKIRWLIMMFSIKKLLFFFGTILGTNHICMYVCIYICIYNYIIYIYTYIFIYIYIYHIISPSWWL